MKWILTISLIFSSTTLYPMLVLAQTQKPASTQSSSQQTSRPVFVPPKPPSRLGTVTGRRTGMGSRNNCPNVATPLTALVPSQKMPSSKQNGTSALEVVGGLTVSERPTFWFYVPYTNNKPGSNAEFSLQDSAGNEIHRSPIALSSTASVIGVTLPSKVALQVDKPYRWYFKVRCTEQQSASVPIYVEGYVKRVNLNPNLVRQLEAATPQQKVAIYGGEGIWYDSVNTLAQLHLSNPKDQSIKADWQTLLQSADLESVSNFPLSQPVAN